MAVLKITSPARSPIAPNATPGQVLPSSSASSAGIRFVMEAISLCRNIRSHPISQPVYIVFSPRRGEKTIYMKKNGTNYNLQFQHHCYLVAALPQRADHAVSPDLLGEALTVGDN